MALTQAQRIALFQILEVPLSSSYYTTDGMGSLSVQFTTPGATTGQANANIDSFLTNIDNATNGNPPGLGAGTSAILAVDLDRWNTLGSSVTKIESGGIGDINGASDDPKDERALIKERVKYIVPFYRWHEVLEKRNASGGNSIAVTF